MIEAVPRDPYGGYISDLLLVEKNMQLRRKRLHGVLKSNEIAPSSGNFPMLGVDGYEHTRGGRGDVANSRYLNDAVINPHPRFGTLTRNIRMRKQENVDINIAKGVDDIGKINSDTDDVNGEGKIPVGDNVPKQDGAAHRLDDAAVEGLNDDMIHMDAMAFGMGCCCLQVTMQVHMNCWMCVCATTFICTSMCIYIREHMNIFFCI
jgi:glutamate--cysteine ligase catalytic subunit